MIRRFFGRNQHVSAAHSRSSGNSSGDAAVAVSEAEEGNAYSRVESGSSSSDGSQSGHLNNLRYQTSRVRTSGSFAKQQQQQQQLYGGTPGITAAHSTAAATALQFAIPIDDSVARAVWLQQPVDVDDFYDGSDLAVALEQEQLADAWFARRQLHRMIRKNQNQNAAAAQQQNRPIDVDTVQEYYPGQQYLANASTNQNYVEDGMGSVSEAGIVSNATSDQTPVVSNRAARGMFFNNSSRSSKANSRASRSAGAVSIGDVPSESTETPTCLGHFYSFMNFKTGWGKLVVLLLVVLVFGLITSVTSAVVAGRGSEPEPELYGATSTTIFSSRPTAAPSDAPTREGPSMAPSSAPSLAPSVASTMSFGSLRLQQLDPLQGIIPGEAFGSAISLATNGLVMAVAAPDVTVNGNEKAGSVQVYWRNSANNGSTWIPRGPPLIGRNDGDQFGSAVACNADGSVVAISEPTHDGAGDRAGNVRTYLYEANIGEYVPMGQELAGNVSASYFGVSVALSESGKVMAVGAPYHSIENRRRLRGQVRVYGYNGETWELLGEPLSGKSNFDWLGWDVDLSASGRVLVASAPRNTQQEGYVMAWEWQEGDEEWVPLGDAMANDFAPADSSDFFGQSISITNTETAYRVAIGAPLKDTDDVARSGMAVVYEYDRTIDEWFLLGQPLIADTLSVNDQAGYSVDLVAGNLLAVGVPGSNQETGKVQVYRYDDALVAWQRHPETWTGLSSGDDFGFSVSLAKSSADGIVLAVGALTANREGAGYVATFQQQRYAVQQADQPESVSVSVQLMACSSDC